MSPQHPLVLVVEDDPESAELLESLLVERGCRVLLAHDGESALEMVGELPHPDLVLLDLELPVMDGRELLRIMRAEKALAHVPVVVISSAHDAATVNATDNVRKCALLEGLHRVFERLQLHEQNVPESMRVSA